MKNMLWGNAFQKIPSQAVLEYCSGWDALPFPALDALLLPYEIKANVAHAQMLCTQGIITEQELSALTQALANASEAVAKGEFSLEGFEDMHSALEFFLKEKTQAALKIHSGRSRNDLIATSTRLFLLDESKNFITALEDLIAVLESTSKKYAGVSMPGFSHHRIAMPFTYGKWLDSYACAFKRDVQSFKDFTSLYNECPLGACAGFGTSFPIAPSQTAASLGFSKPFSNSLDAVQQRWEAEASFCFSLVKTMNHLSQLAQTFIVLSMDGMNLLSLPEEYCTGSSVMPHKKNPDFLEATKAKASLAASALHQLIDAGKNSFTGYNRDSQWTKKSLLHAVLECALAPALMAGLIDATVPNEEKMALLSSSATRTREAEALALDKGVPFRLAKQMVEEEIKTASALPALE